MTVGDIVHASAEHSAVIAVLHGTSFPAPWSSDEFTTLLQQPGVAAWLCLNGVPSGFILVRAAADEAEILTIAVAPNCRRQGVAKRLLATACTALRTAGTRRLFLEVSADNMAAIELYRSHGFDPCGTRSGYYRKNGKTVDAVVMALVL